MNFISFTYKRWERYIRAQYLLLIQFIQVYLYKRLLIPNLLKYPTGFILYPCTLFLILSYPALYSLYSSPSLVFGNDFYGSKFIKSVAIEETTLPFQVHDYSDLNDVDFVFNTFWLQPSLEYHHHDYAHSKLGWDPQLTSSGASIIQKPFFNALNKSFLLDVLELQESLLSGLQLYPNDSIFLISPLEYWSNDNSTLSKDKLILRTIQDNQCTRTETGLPMNNLELISGVVKVDGLIKSADSLRFTIFYPSNKALQVEQTLQENLQNINNMTTNFIIVQETEDYAKHSKFKLTFKTCNVLERLLIVVSPILALIYMIIALTNVHMVKSRTGLFLAYMVELSLALCSASTITSYLYRSDGLLQVPSTVILSTVLFIATENMFRLVVSVSKMSDDWSLASRIHQALSKTGPISTSIVFLVSSFLVLCIPFCSSTAQQYCLFASLCLIFDHALQITYFAAVLAVDIRRLELEDLLQRSTQLDLSQNENITQLKALGAGSILSSVLFNSSNHATDVPYKRMLGQYLLKIRLPLFTTVKHTLIAVFFILVLVFKWTNGVQYKWMTPLNTLFELRLDDDHPLHVFKYPNFDIFSNKRGFATELLLIYQGLTKSSSRKNIFNLIMNQPKIAILKEGLIFNANAAMAPLTPVINFQLGSTYKFDIFYIFEFLSFLMFVVFGASAVLKSCIDEDGLKFGSLPDDNLIDDGSSRSGHHSSEFHQKELVKGHFLDVVKISTSVCPFVVSVGMDHKILVWSPLTNPLPAPTQLPVSGRFLPVTNVVMSNSGSYIAVFSKNGIVKCWSRLQMTWIWTIQIEELTNSNPLESFFRRRSTVAVSNKRRAGGKLTSRKSKAAKEKSTSEDAGSAAPTTTKKKLKPRGRAAGLAENARVAAPAVSHAVSPSPMLQHQRSMSMDSTFNRSTNLKKLSVDSFQEFIIILKNGKMVNVNCTNGEIGTSELTSYPIVCCKKLSSPRVNDRLVCISETGSLVVATVINNKWKARNINVQTESYNSGKSLITPAAISRAGSMNLSSLDALAKLRSGSLNKAASQNSYRQIQQQQQQQQQQEEKVPPPPTSHPIFEDDFSDVVMETVAFVGMIVRAFGSKAQLIDVQTGTLIKEFLIGQFKPSTFQVFHPEPSHCRFCGCASVASFSIAYTELETNTLIMHTFSIDNRAKNNICLRVERDVRETRCLGFVSVTEHQHWLSGVEGWCATDLNMLMGVRRKEKEDISNMSDLPSQSSSFKLLQQLSGNDKNALRNRQSTNQERKKFHHHPKLSDIWEGWTMSSNGQVRYYEIPDGSDSGLLIKRLGPVHKFGHKSIVVSFGNIMKILYLGNDNLIEEGDTDGESLSPLSQTSSSLSFINRRRKLTLKKYELTHSTNFNDSPRGSTSSIVDDESDVVNED